MLQIVPRTLMAKEVRNVAGFGLLFFSLHLFIKAELNSLDIKQSALKWNIFLEDSAPLWL